MGHQALRDRGKTSETDSGQSDESDGPQRWPSRADVGPTTVGRTTKEDIEEYYGREISSVDELQELQRLERGYGGQVLRWIDEGMPIGAMGHKTKMQRFRERKGTPIPWDIEHFNRLSRMDNTGKVNRDRRRGPDGETGVPDSVREVISSPGRALDTSIQRAVEERMGDSLGDVRIHTGPKAAAAADEIDARAFTVGNHVAFGAGEYDPESVEGQHVLVHELAHVRQQTGGAVSMLPRDADLDPAVAGTVGEKQRDGGATVQRLLAGSALGVDALGAAPVYLQRSEQQPRDDLGRYQEIDRADYDGKRYGYQRRPPYAPGQVEEVWQRAKERGLKDTIEDPNTGKELSWDRDEDRWDQWHMGHKEEREYRVLVEYYLFGAISEEEFVNEYQDPEHYRPEAPRPNMSRRYEADGEYWEQKWGSIDQYTDD